MQLKHKPRMCISTRCLGAFVMPLFCGMPVHAQGLSAQEIFAKVSDAVWGVSAYDGDGRRIATGSGVAFEEKRVVTNCHVLAKAKGVAVDRQNVSYTARLLHADPERDLCILSIDNFKSVLAEIAPVDALKPGAKAFAIGNPRRLELTISEGLISSIRRNTDGSVRSIQTSAPISPGSSGGGLFDDSGRLVGITTLELLDSQNLNFAAPAQWILEVPSRAAAALAKRSTRNQPPLSSGSATLKSFSGDDTPAVGDEYAYDLTDLLLSKTRPVVYRVTKADTSGTHFENGHIETALGSFRLIDNVANFHYEEMAPVGGWIQETPVAGATWQVSYTPRNPTLRATTLRAVVSGPVYVSTPFGNLETMLISYSGIGAGDSTTGTAGSSNYRFTASVWWSPRLKRVVQIESERRFDTFRRSYEKERLTLVSMRRLFDQ